MLHEGDADGPLLVAIADVKRMLGVREAAALVPRWRAEGRTETHDGVEYLTFPIWRPIGTTGFNAAIASWGM